MSCYALCRTTDQRSPSGAGRSTLYSALPELRRGSRITNGLPAHETGARKTQGAAPDQRPPSSTPAHSMREAVWFFSCTTLPATSIRMMPRPRLLSGHLLDRTAPIMYPLDT